MNLGERIYRLRTQKNLSQGDLAEMLEVSRQSISKWENNNAVPDLEKITKLSDILEVSLDELVKGEVSQKADAVKAVPVEKSQEVGFPPRKIVGTILLCMAVLAELLLPGLIFVLPFLICGILCFALRKNIGLWCAWTVYVCWDMYMQAMTGITRETVLHTLQWTPEMNYMRLAFAWALVFCLAALILVTVLRYRKKSFSSLQQGKKKMIIAWAVFAIIYFGLKMWSYIDLYVQFIGMMVTKMLGLFVVFMFVLSWLKIITFTLAAVFTARYITMKRTF